MKPLDHLNHNRHAWDRLAKSGNRFAKPAGEKDLENPLASVDGPGWLGKSIAGKKVLCLAAGGGRQGPVYAAAGADVTVVDISPAMLELDNDVARKLGLSLRTIETSMDNLSMLADGSFDIVIQPVSSCYLPKLTRMFREVARVSAKGCVYVSQHKQPSSLQTSIRPTANGYVWQLEASSSSALKEPATPNLVREPGTLEYVHSLQDILGGMCRAGFAIEEFLEPQHADVDADVGSFEHRSRFVCPYMRIKAVLTRGASDPGLSPIWKP
jgi:SAM-dependent methyltransferase